MNTCCKCIAPAEVTFKRGTKYCAPCYRIKQMRNGASVGGKSVPTVEEMIVLVAAAMARKMQCETCNRTMVWLSRDGASAVVTLQHDRDGTHRLLCMRCNLRHASCPDDSFYEIPNTHKFCNTCERTLPRESFSINRATPIGLCGPCKECMRASRHPSEAVSRKRRAARERELRARKIAEVAK